MSRIRLICPNCGAQYEVPLEVIPEAGRDVQCSSCQHTWFQHHPDFAPEPEPEPAPEPTPPPAPEPSPPPAPKPAAPPPAPQEPYSETFPDTYDDAEPDPAPAPVPPRPLPPEIAEVFAEERAFETRRRHAEGGVLETQPDLGLEPPEEDLAERRAAEARAQREALRAPTEPRPPEPPVSRRGRLPDVEEITETLRSNDPSPRVIDSAERAHLDETEDSPPKGGFARGFFIAVLLAALGLAVYASAPQIAEAAPALAAPLDSYVAVVDQARGWLDGQMAEWLGRLDGMSSQAAPDANG